MEKAIVNYLQEVSKNNKTFWTAKLVDGRNATVWDEDLANTINQNIGVAAMYDIQTKGNFTNIRGIAPVGSIEASIAPTSKPIVPQEARGLDNKNKSIISQTILKGCVELAINSLTSDEIRDHEKLTSFMTHTADILIGNYLDNIKSL